MAGLVARTAAFYNNASVSPSIEQLSKDKVIYAVSVPEQVSVAWCNYVLFLSPFLTSWWMLWKAVVVITEKLHPETGTSPLSNSQELRSRDQFLFGVGEECWCERWSYIVFFMPIGLSSIFFCVYVCVFTYLNKVFISKSRLQALLFLEDNCQVSSIS